MQFFPEVIFITVLVLMITLIINSGVRVELHLSGPGWECVFPKECLRSAMDALPAQPDGFQPRF